jgi:hypothetical protein
MDKKSVIDENTDGTKKEKRLAKWILVSLFVVVLIVILFYTINWKPNPMSQFETKKDCTFLIMPDISRAVCTDGTVYDVKQIASPLP